MPGRNTKSNRYQLWRKQKGLCWWCGRKCEKPPREGWPGKNNWLAPNAATLDHVYPQYDARRDSANPKVMACHECNKRRNAEFQHKIRQFQKILRGYYFVWFAEGYVVEAEVQEWWNITGWRKRDHPGEKGPSGSKVRTARLKYIEALGGSEWAEWRSDYLPGQEIPLLLKQKVGNGADSGVDRAEPIDSGPSGGRRNDQGDAGLRQEVGSGGNRGGESIRLSSDGPGRYEAGD